ncbi:helix-turn-helix domain-containing protein [Streptomyces sp. SKN60]|uniref:IclR family transcriptional regulator n=1 Tax=Streptomyces sp. SKN60 TaxID=2855506 RepID=UPI00224822F7|nr:helix-turn-helix domain-containing protein [Streptomyces sp. SKN60]MCX2180451.1 helix-turn-helix domain-containing protein [Streptomyces sp. SKN60]
MEHAASAGHGDTPGHRATPGRGDTANRGGRGVLEGAFALLEALRRHGDEPAGVTELALACGVPKGTAHRLLDQLVAVGAVERRDRRYRVGPQLYRLGLAWEPHPGLRAAARLPLHRLRASTGASVLLVVEREDQALTVSSVPGELEPVVPVRDGVGFRLDTAAGLALRGPRRAGAVLDREDVMAGVCCAALPVRAPDGRTVAAVAGMIRAGRALEPLAEAVAEAAGALARGLARGMPAVSPAGLFRPAERA